MDSPATNISIQVGLGKVGPGSAVDSRSRLAAIRADPADVAVARPLAIARVAGTLARGGSVPFTAKADPARVPVPAGGQLTVYPLVVSVTATVGGHDEVEIARTTTFLVVTPARVAAMTGIAVVLPIADRPRLAPSGTALLDNDLAGEVAPGGRLDRLLAAATGRGAPPVTLAVDPETTRAIDLMASGSYEVLRAGRAVRQPASPAAGKFLASLRKFAGSGGRVVALPYGDPDVVALVRAGQLQPVRAAVLRGREWLANVLGRPPDGTVAYPPGGVADETTLDLLRRINDGGKPITTVVLAEATLPAPSSLKYTPGAATTVAAGAGRLDAVVADGQLAKVIADGLTQSPGAARASYLAETAMLTAERPQQGRPQVIALPRDWNPSQGWLNTVLAGLRTPWSVGVPLATVVSSGSAGQSTRGPLTYPPSAQAAELPAASLDTTWDLWNDVWRLWSVLCQPVTATGTSGPATGPSAAPGGPPAKPSAATTAPPATNVATCKKNGRLNSELDALMASTSAAWRSEQAGGDDLRSGVAAANAAIRDHIRLVASRSVTLTSRKGRVPITLENDLDVTISVRLALSAPDMARLASQAAIPRTLGPRQKAQIEIPVRAESAGSFPVKVALLTPDGKPLSDRPPTQVLVRSTVYGVIATVITICALGVLALAVVIRSVRQVRAARKGRRNPPADPDGPPTAVGAGGRTTGGTG